ncbi:hypothetical protein K440DRAFT_113436 [Wilcoxina mikolae CBS 423.85]|nr:hypothetical protein K440DRAFT_113436 [Wilcoxina mikolae CBS 423.85]
MGNASTKERAASPTEGGGTSLRRPGRNNGEPSSHSSLGRLGSLGGVSGEGYSSRSSRSRHNLEQTLFGLGAGGREARERDREAERAAREQRKKEREEERQREREKSRKEESLDGGFLVTHGVYSGLEDFKDKIVRHFMIERRLAPFWKGLRDHEDTWTDAQLYAAFHDLPIPGPDAEPPKEMEKVTSKLVGSSDSLTVPIASRSRAQSYTSEGSNRSNTSTPSFGFTSRSRAKTLSISSPKNPTLTNTTGPVETNNPSRFVDGRAIEAVLYQHAVECPICFLYYPPYLNRTRCCDQEICSECFVQIKRVDPHIPESHDHAPGDSNSEPNSVADQLVSEPATCPFCKQTDFGVTYSPPPWRRGISYVGPPGAGLASPFSVGSNSSSISLGGSLQSASPPVSPSWKRRTMLPLNAPEVVTSDDIRPDWSAKLQTARSHAARRAAAATALHTAAFFMGGTNTGSGSGSTSGPGNYGRRLIRRAVRENSGSSADRGSESSSPNHSGSGTPSNDTRPRSLLTLGTLGRDNTTDREPSVEERLANLGFISPAAARESAGMLNAVNNRRSRIVDLEEMMLMEAIRLSLAEEEERKRREKE